MNVRSQERVLTWVLGIASLVSGAWIVASLITDTAEGHFIYPLAFISIVAVAVALYTIRMWFVEGAR